MSGQRIAIISHRVEADTDARRLCNVVKRLTCVSTLSLQHNIEAGAIVEAINEITVKALVRLGFDVEDEVRLQKVLPIFLEASGVLLGMGLRGSTSERAGRVDESVVRVAIDSMAAIAKSRSVVKAIERPYGVTEQDVIDLRLTAAAASADIAVAFAALNPPHPLPKLVQVATAFVVEQAMTASQSETPAHANQAARRMLAQSFLTNAAKLYAACVQGYGLHASATDAMTLDGFMNPIHQQFQAAFLVARASSMAKLIEFDFADFKKVYGDIHEQLDREASSHLDAAPSHVTSHPIGQASSIESPSSIAVTNKAANIPTEPRSHSVIARARLRHRHA